MSTTYFTLPTTPDEIGVSLPPANLRQIRYSALDFMLAQRAIVEYIQAYFPTRFNDFVASNGLMMLLELVSAEVAKLSLRGDMLYSQNLLATATTEVAVSNIIALIGQTIRRQTPANTLIEISVVNPVSTAIEIDARTKLTINGPDGQPLIYELFAAPGDFSSKIILPAGKRGVIAYGLEGSFAAVSSFTSSGGPFQAYTIVDAGALESPILITVTAGSATQDWMATTKPIETFGPNDMVVSISFSADIMTLQFGDGVTGKAPQAGQIISVSYRTGGGVRGQISVGQITDVRQLVPLSPANSTTSVTFRNITPSNGGTDRETLDQVRRRAPREASLMGAIVTSDDYMTVANSYSHPVFGTIAKSVAILRSDININQVEIYCLALGSLQELATPNAGLKRGLSTHIADLNVLTDNVVVLDGALKLVDLDMNVVVSRNADATVVKSRVESAITDFFSWRNWELGMAFYTSTLIEKIRGISGVAYVDLFSPIDNILPTRVIAEDGSVGIGFNEIISLGSRNIKYFYDGGRPAVDTGTSTT